jgi:hypothetical protein
VEFARWLDRRFQKSLRRAVPELDRLLKDPRGTLAGQAVFIGPDRKYPSSILLGLALWLIVLVLIGVGLLAGPPNALGKLPSGLLVLLVGAMALVLIGFIWLVLQLRRGGEVVLTEDGVELRYRRSVVICPWALFNAPGQPFLPRYELLLLPVAPEAVPFVEVREDGTPCAAGQRIKTKQLRFKSAGEAALAALYEVHVGELGKLLLRLGRELGAALPANSAMHLTTPGEASSAAAAPAVMDKNGWITARLTRLVFPPFCCDCGAATDQYLEFRGYGRLLRLGRSFTIESNQFATLGVPVCRACQRDNWWKYYKTSLAGLGLGLAVPLVIILALYLAAGLVMPIWMVIVTIGFGAMIGGLVGELVGRRLAAPVKLERYAPSQGTIAIRFRWPAYGERLLAFIHAQEGTWSETIPQTSGAIGPWR